MEFKEFSGELIPAFEDKAISKILELEGGYREKDPVTGQPVKYGIDQRANPDINVKDLTEADARRIYSDRYYRKSGADKLPEDLALVHFDAAVNQGNMAQKFLEQSGGDLDKYIELRRAHYINLAEQDPARYGSSLKGWLNRLDKVEQEAKGMRQEFVPFEGELDIGGKPKETTKSPFKGAAARASSLLGEGIEGVARVAEKAGDYLEEKVPLSGLSKEEIRGKRQLEPLFQWADSLRGWGKEIGYEPSTTLKDLGGNPLKTVPFIVERVVASSPDMAAAVAAMPAYIYARTNEILNDRIKNDEKSLEDVTVGDIAISAGSAVVEGMLERFTTSRLLKGGVAPGKTAGERVAKEGALQSATGGIEEGVGYLGGTAGTKKGVDPQELAENVIEGAIVEGGLGASVRGGKEVYDKYKEVKPENVIPPERVEPQLKEPTAEEQFAEAPQIEVRGVGQVPTSEALDYEAMLAELEGRDIPTPVAEKQLSEEIETVEPTPAELKSEPVQPVETPKIEKDELLARLDREDVRNELKYLAENAGWAQVGGRILREDAEDQTSPVVGRTQWIPKQEWWTGRPATKSGSGELNERQTQKAVEKALNGQPLNAKERRMIEYMLNVADTNISAYEEYAQQEREALEDQRRQFGLEAPTPEDLRAQEESRRAREDEAARIEAQEEAERERQEVRRLGERGAEDFALGRTAAEDLMGQKSVFEQPVEEDIDTEMARKAKEGRAEIERRRLAGEQDYDIPFNIERIADKAIVFPDEIERTPSLRVELNRLVKANREGTIPPETFAMRVEQAIDSTKKERKPVSRERGENIIREKLIRAKRRGELSDEAVDLAEWFIKKNPALVDDIAISVRAPKENEMAAGMYNPASRIVYLIKGSNNTETAVHEILHHTERMMPADIQKAIQKAWAQSLAKADREAQKGTDADLKKYFQTLMDFHFNGNSEAMRTAKNMLNNGTVGYEQYQYINPSEFWAVNASDIVAKRYAATNSIVGKLKRWLAELAETLKSLFGLDNKAPLIKALNSLSKADGKFVSDKMLAEAVDYENIHRNYKGDAAPLATWNEPNDSKISDFLYKIQDRFIDVKDVQKAITEKVGQIEDQWDVYLKEELYHGRSARQAKDFLKDELMPILNRMAKEKVNLQDFDHYLHNRHAQEYNEHVAKINPDMPDGGSGILTEDANAYLNGLDPKKKALYESLAKDVDNIVRGTQDILVKSGIEEKATVDAWNKTFKKYVPLFREDLDFAPTSGTGLGMGYGVRGAFSKRAMGSFKDVADIFANIAAQREKAIVRAEKARVGRALYGLAIKNPNPDFWLPVNPDAIKNKDALKNELRYMGLDEADAESIIQEPKTSYIDPKTGLVAYRVNPILRSSPNVFPVRINGKDRYIFFNPSDARANRMVRSLKNLDADQLGTILGITAKITRWIASVNTQYNPVFGAYNFIRDVGSAQFNLSTTPIRGKQAQVTANVFPALRAIYRDVRRERAGKDPVDNEMSKLWQEFQREGGITGYRDQFSKTKKENDIIQQELDKLTEGGAKQAAMKPVRALFNWLSDYNDSMENAVRLAAYKVALDQGLSKERAASLAKNLTVNFNRKGEKAVQLGALYAFFNASVQGTKRLQETLSGPAGKKIIGGGLMLGVLQALMLAAAGFDEDEPPEFVKERNIIIPLGDGKYAAFPMPLGLHVIPSTGRTLTEFMISGGKDPAKTVGNLLSMYLGAFNPIGNSGISMQSIAPTALDPVAAIFENRDNFGRPIAKEDRATNPTPGYTRTRDNASFIGKQLSEFLNYASGGTKYQKGLFSPTPDQIDYLIGQATGGVGREVQKIEQLFTGDEEVPPHKIPLVGKFYGDAGSQSAQKNKFYNNIVKMANHEQEIKGRIKNREGMGDYYDENPEARLWRMANRVENEITELNKRKKEMKARGASPEAIKRIDELKMRKMQQFNERVAEAEGR